MKKIGITTKYVVDSDYQIPVVGMTQSYARSVAKAGGLPIYLPLEIITPENKEGALMRIKELAGCLDGLILAGGEDVNPVLYNEQPHEKLESVSDERDKYELALFHEFLKTGKKILGICRGHQLINVALGGTLYQDIPSQYQTNIAHSEKEDKWYSPAHVVAVKAESLLHEVLGVAGCKVNSIHHQAIKDLSPDLIVAGTCLEDKLIEACESHAYPQILTVQWHPETMWDESKMNAKEQLHLFRWIAE